MAAPCFYCPQLNDRMIINEDSIISLSEIESSHAVRSRRLRVGDEVNLITGQGVLAYGSIDHVDKRNVRVKIEGFEATPQRAERLSIASAIPKGDRQKVMLDMLTQLGVSDVFPLVCEHSVTRYSDNLGDKWRRASIEACKQSRNVWVPTIHEGQSVDQLNGSDEYHVVYADIGGCSMASARDTANKNDLPLLVMIGPEGGFSSSELAYFKKNEIAAVTLGGNILRTEAASISAMAQFVSLIN